MAQQTEALARPIAVGTRGGIKRLWAAQEGMIIGAISVIIGLLLLGSPLGYVAALPLVIGIFAVVGGVFTIIFAFRLRSA